MCIHIKWHFTKLWKITSQNCANWFDMMKTSKWWQFRINCEVISFLSAALMSKVLCVDRCAFRSSSFVFVINPLQECETALRSRRRAKPSSGTFSCIFHSQREGWQEHSSLTSPPPKYTHCHFFTMYNCAGNFPTNNFPFLLTALGYLCVQSVSVYRAVGAVVILRRCYELFGISSFKNSYSKWQPGERRPRDDGKEPNFNLEQQYDKSRHRLWSSLWSSKCPRIQVWSDRFFH